MTVAELGSRMSALEAAEWKVFLDGESGPAAPEAGQADGDDLDLLAAKFEARYGGK